ncbi:MAG: PBP1A family penicillin-binding protein [Holosporaceae bacterium]|jgi:penicillin-binding protein 1A|nr:PBP1A family penicillin-binding protein [Holosporaceae bacterium]
MKRFFKIIVLLAFLGISAALAALYIMSLDLPDHTLLKKYAPELSSRVFLKNGEKLCEYSSEKRYFIPIERVPKKLINAFLSAEDKRFYEHIGIDIVRIFVSFINNLQNMRSGKRPHGASTITQQVARIFLIKSNEISYLRKIQEAILSRKIESALSKNEILELYLNQIYLGAGTYGVAAAAKVYFNKTVNELTVAECSYLASLAKGASNYHPVKNRERALKRRNWLIKRQLQDGFINKKTAQAALKEDLVMAPQEENVTAEYFSEEVRKYLIEKLRLSALNSEGLIIRGTLDMRFQDCAYRALRKGLEKVDRKFGWRGALATIDTSDPDKIVAQLKELNAPPGSREFKKAVVTKIQKKKVTLVTEDKKQGEVVEGDVRWAKNLHIGDVILVSSNDEGGFNIRQIPAVQGAIIVIEANTGRILAMQGGYDFSQSEFNRATQAMRQCGSVFKPFVYLTALENGFSPNSVINAEAMEIDTGAAEIWKPKNYHGSTIEKITLRRAIEKSVNTATVRISYELGVNKISKLAQQFGIFETMPEFLSFALGAGETTLEKITAAYAMIANGGKRITPTMIDYVQDKKGNVIYRMAGPTQETKDPFNAGTSSRLNDNREQIVNEQSVYQMISLLEGVVQRGSGWEASTLGIPVGGKTGTSNESRDTWFVGITPDIAVGVFVGFDDYSKSLGKDATGTSTALPIFVDFMAKIKKFLTAKPFRIPKGIRLRKVDLETGGPPSPSGKGTIMEAFKNDEVSDGLSPTMQSTGSNKLRDLIFEKAKSDTATAIQPKSEPQSTSVIIGTY